MKTLIIDNYDSFTYNLYQLVGEIQKNKPVVVYNDKFNLKDFNSWNVGKVIISPGPGRPENRKDFGMSSLIIQQAKIPVLGVCLGHQGIGFMFGAKITQSPEIMHGRRSKIFHNGRGIFENIPQGFNAVRYHSFVIEKLSLPEAFELTAWTNEEIIMAIKHRQKNIFGIQFHPESIGTEYGKEILENFLKTK